MYREVNGYVASVEPPLSGPDMDLLKPFRVEYNGTTKHIYTPFNPWTWKLPAQVGDKFISRKVGDTIIWYSPNVHRAFLKHYVKADENGNPYFTQFPALFVDYGTPLAFYYVGANKPPDRDLELQFKDWKNGWQLTRRQLPNPGWSQMEITTCVKECHGPGCPTACLERKTFHFAEGWYWVKHQARLLDLPATLLVGVSDVIVFTYKKPDNIVFKIPGFSSVADYIVKRKLSGEGVRQLGEMLATFGYEVDYTASYMTKSGKRATGPVVEESGDYYYVYLPIRKKTASLELISAGTAILLLAVAIFFAVAVYYVVSMESLKQEGMKAYLYALIDAQNNYTRCVSACNAYSDEEQREKCLLGCRGAYEKSTNEAKEAYEDWKKGVGSEFKEITELIKWGLVALVAVNVIGAMRRD